jgi:phosphate/sulfate permease
MKPTALARVITLPASALLDAVAFLLLRAVFRPAAGSL